jgi:deazaflavin-dependent oxidoreductase (nitroreductase family)
MPLPKSLARSNKHLANRVIGPVAPCLPLFGVVHHVGRVSGRAYHIPVNVFRDGDGYIVALTYGSDTDWVKNVLAAGSLELERFGKRIMLTDPEIRIDPTNAWAQQPVRFFLNRIGVTERMHLRIAG